eukprot:XP_016868387.1 uncharacterized protein LOC107984014 [Homo sapiens]
MAGRASAMIARAPTIKTRRCCCVGFMQTIMHLPSEDLNFLLGHLISTVLQLRSDPSDRKSHIRYLPSEDLNSLLGHLIPTVLQVPAVGRFDLSTWTPNTHSPPGTCRRKI